MRMWGAGFGFAAVRAVTRDKKPVSIPFLKWNEIPQRCAGLTTHLFGRIASAS